jgi:hypothetical protein
MWNVLWCTTNSVLAATLVGQYVVYAYRGWLFATLHPLPVNKLKQMGAVAALPAAAMVVGIPITAYYTTSCVYGPLGVVFFACELLFLPVSGHAGAYAVGCVLVVAACVFTAVFAVAVNDHHLYALVHVLPLLNVWLNDCVWYLHTYSTAERLASSSQTRLLVQLSKTDWG